MPDPLVKKRKEASGEAVDGKRAKVEALPLDVQLKNGVTPYWDIPYEQQASHVVLVITLSCCPCSKFIAGEKIGSDATSFG